LNADIPYKAAALLQKGLDDGTIDSTLANWRLLAQAWQLSQNFEKALPALQKASSLAEDGEIDRMLGQSYIRLARWQECVDASQKALDRGGLREPAYVQIQLGTCLLNQRKFQEARSAFVAARADENRRQEAQTFINYVDEEIKRQRANDEALASLRNR
jgi:tetratricopeptide (TPR) repeat protein